MFYSVELTDPKFTSNTLTVDLNTNPISRDFFSGVLNPQVNENKLLRSEAYEENATFKLPSLVL